MTSLLTARDVSVRYRVAGDPIAALRSVSIEIQPQQSVGLLGESGSGKSTLAATLLGSTARGASSSGIISFSGFSLLEATEADLRKIRGARISYIAQDPAQALSPVLKVGEQIADLLRAHTSMNRGARKAAVIEALHEVGLDAQMYHAYPHQLSGGQRQRVAIAQALVCRPELLIADEPTTALDATTQADILRVISTLQSRHGMALLLISHDPAVMAEMVDYVYVLRNGEVVEHGAAHEVLNHPASIYTRSLLEATPGLAFHDAG
jgi:peptide/nickel transport system ATP-binding protein